MKALPLFYYPTRWIWVDDDSSLLKTSARLYGQLYPIVSFNQPSECLDFLQKYQAPLTKKQFLQPAVDDEDYGTLKNMPMDFDITSLVEIAELPERHNEISGIIIDYGMPELNGLMLAKKIKSLPIKKILLTGEAEDSDAIIAFNDNLIDCFVRKGDAETSTLLRTYLKQLASNFLQEKTAGLLAYLETEGPISLTDPVFIKFFQDYCAKNSITEYYLLDKQGSFMLINARGGKSFLNVHTEKSLNDLLELYYDVDKTSELLTIQHRQRIPFFGVGKEGWEIDLNCWGEHLYEPHVLEGRERYYWTTVEYNRTLTE